MIRMRPMHDPTEPTTPEAALYAEFKAATLALRDAELAMIAAKDKFEKAQAAMIKGIAQPKQG